MLLRLFSRDRGRRGGREKNPDVLAGKGENRQRGWCEIFATFFLSLLNGIDPFILECYQFPAGRRKQEVGGPINLVVDASGGLTLLLGGGGGGGSSALLYVL